MPAASAETSGLLDVNSDGLPDRWSTTVLVDPGYHFSDPILELNNGAGFVQQAGPMAVRPGNDDFVTASAWGGPHGSDISQGYRIDTSRAIDVDGDGRPDVVKYSPYAPDNNYFQCFLNE